MSDPASPQVDRDSDCALASLHAARLLTANGDHTDALSELDKGIASCATLMAHRAVLRELVKAWRCKAPLENGDAYCRGVAVAYEMCADEIDAALSSGEGRTPEQEEKEKTLGS